jgi:hypothetical protein
MQKQSTPSSRPRVLLEPFKPVSIFLCPCHVSPDKLSELVEKTKAKAAQADKGELLELRLEVFEEECLGLHVNIQPQLFFLSNIDWVILTLIAELSPVEGNSITFEQMLAFNSNFRVCQGELERQDTPTVGLEKLAFYLSSGRRVADVFKQVAVQTLGVYDSPSTLKRTVTLSIARFERMLNDSELYAFGTIAHSDELVDPAWASKAVQERVYDRWRSAGIRFFVHSYSLVCGCASEENLMNQHTNWPIHIFLEDYVRVGVRLALERAELMELRSALQGVGDLSELRRLRGDWVDFRRVLGIRWTAEGTQRAQIEQVWRQVSGMEKNAGEIDRRFEQTIELFEAQAADRLNRLLTWFQIVVTGLAAAGVTAQITQNDGWRVALPWSLGIGILATVLSWFWLRYGLRRKGKDKQR